MSDLYTFREIQASVLAYTSCISDSHLFSQLVLDCTLVICTPSINPARPRKLSMGSLSSLDMGRVSNTEQVLT